MLETDIERQQFLELYEQYGNAMLLVARKFFGQDYGLAEDAVQNAWTRVVENFPKIQAVPCKKRGAYLVIIVRNESISIIRKRRKEIPLNEAIVGEEFDIEDSSQPILDIIHKIQSVAVFLLVCSLTLGTIMVASPTVRAAVVAWFIEWYDTHIIYRFSGKPNAEIVPEYEITELPSGYVAPGEVQELIDGRAITYRNVVGDTIYFEYVHVESGSALMVKTERVESTEVKVNGHAGYLYLSKDLEEVERGYRFPTGGGFYYSDSGGPTVNASASITIPTTLKNVSISFGINLGQRSESSGFFVSVPNKTDYFKLYIEKELEIRPYVVYRKRSGTEGKWEVDHCGSVEVVVSVTSYAKKV